MDNKALQKRLEAMRNNNQDAFFDIYEDMKTPVYTIIYRILYDHAASEDVMQDIFLRLYKAPPSSSVKKPRSWIFQMARNLAIDSKRKTRDNQILSHQLESDDLPLENRISVRMDIEQALKQLSEQERGIVTLHLNGDLKFREVAELVEQPLGTVLWRYQKALGKLRQTLSGGE